MGTWYISFKNQMDGIDLIPLVAIVLIKNTCRLLFLAMIPHVQKCNTDQSIKQSDSVSCLIYIWAFDLQCVINTIAHTAKNMREEQE
jgi:hypothetical protein